MLTLRVALQPYYFVFAIRNVLACTIVLAIALISVWPRFAHAAAGNWNCERSQADGEWVCIAKKPQHELSADPSPAAMDAAADVVPKRPAVVERAPGSELRPQPVPRTTVARPVIEAPVVSAPVAALKPLPESLRQPVDEDDEEEDDVTPGTEKTQITAVPTLQDADAPGEKAVATARVPRELAPLLHSQPRMVAAGNVVLHKEPDSPDKAEVQHAAPGWSCNTAEDRKTWDCDLVGADPRGLAHTIDADGHRGSLWTDAKTITREDEQRFSGLVALMPSNPWAHACSGKTERDPMKDFLLTPQDRMLRETAPTDVRGNYAELQDQEIATFTGTAEVSRADQKILGQALSFNTAANTVNARGNVLYREKGMAMASDSAFMHMDDGKGVLRNAQFIVETLPSRGTARTVTMDSKSQIHFDNSTYTTCPPGNADWLLHADTVDMDKVKGWGVARHAWMEFEGLPMFYTPYIRFPIDDRRQSGLLTPTFGQSRVGGFNISAPYYFNLAPNYDDTLILREVTNRGGLIGNEFRYMTDSQTGRLVTEIMPYDRVMQQARGIVGYRDQGMWSENLSSLVDINYVSDQLYLNQLGNSLRLVPSLFMHSQANLSYQMDNFNVRFLSDYFQTIDPSIPNQAKPYNRLPAIQANYRGFIGDSGFLFETKSEAASFSHNSDDVKGQRFNLKPTLSYPVRNASGFVVPSLSLQSTNYLLSDLQPGQDGNLNRFAPIASVDSGLSFERNFNLGNNAMVQTLEPRLFYLYVPHINQKDYPLFDSTYYDYTFNQIFRENRFVGSDRIGDANQASVALTSRFLDAESGRERFRASVGKVMYITDPTVTLASNLVTPLAGYNDFITYQNPADTYNFNDYISEVAAQLTREWGVEAVGQASPNRGQIERGTVALRYDNERNQLLNLSYTFRRATTGTFNTLNQTEASFRLPLARDWYAIGRWQYSMLYNLTLDSFAGIERDTCCWRLSVIGRRYQNGVNEDKEPTTNTGVFVQLEIKGLTRLGDQVDQFLYRSMEGYRRQSDLEDPF